jgi:EAL domain-containing protein (putative c-di-GMP-specific phosphodiesterase class I)
VVTPSEMIQGVLLRGQIRTVFQPLVDLRTCSVRGWEALSRGPTATPLHDARELFRAAEEAMAVDNVGVGYSGLEKIARVAPNYVTLHRVLVGDLDISNRQREVIRALKAFADNLGATVIATGIEREAELQALQDLGVQYGQGWFLGRPFLRLISVPRDTMTAVKQRRRQALLDRPERPGREGSYNGPDAGS